MNAEFLGTRYVGAVGGQPDYFRAARASMGGLAILALAASAGPGASRVVPRCSHVTTASSDVDLVVTEHGVADLRGATLRERAERVAGIADPLVREQLLRQIPG